MLAFPQEPIRFNPCFNGTMYKNIWYHRLVLFHMAVSILVLMELCIKTGMSIISDSTGICFNPCFNGTMYKNDAKKPY